MKFAGLLSFYAMRIFKLGFDTWFPSRFGKKKIGAKEYLTVFNGTFYEELEKEYLIELIRLAKNSLKNLDLVNTTTSLENHKVEEEFNRPPKRNPKKKIIKPGSIYCVKCTHTGFYKIGQTTASVESRIAQLSTANPTIELLWAVKVRDVECERKTHKYFESKRVRGEWFDFDEKTALTIKKVLEQSYGT